MQCAKDHPRSYFLNFTKTLAASNNNVESSRQMAKEKVSGCFLIIRWIKPKLQAVKVKNCLHSFSLPLNIESFTIFFVSIKTKSSSLLKKKTPFTLYVFKRLKNSINLFIFFTGSNMIFSGWKQLRLHWLTDAAWTLFIWYDYWWLYRWVMF